ncbi:MAG: hypothetical protein IPK07_04095 [Deltaproteobacteria bacterium]|nr:hypothetical protein [Deltaproteobacteria bacterium]
MTGVAIDRFREPGTATHERVVAAIDVGTNMVRLRVERVTRDWHSLVAHDWAITRLGGGQRPGGPLDPTAMERTLVVLERFAERARAHGASEVWTAGTCAVREASNQAEFVRSVRSRTGLDLDVIRGDEEARLDAMGVIADSAGREGRRAGGHRRRIDRGGAHRGRQSGAGRELPGRCRATDRAIRADGPPDVGGAC